MLGETIAHLRESKGLTQAKFAEMIHATHGAISQWETGRTSPDVQQMFILADFFGITVEELSSGAVQQDTKTKDTKIAPADMRAEAKTLLERMTDEEYERALAILRALNETKKEKYAK